MQTAKEPALGDAMRRFSTAAVLLHHALAEGLGLGPTDHKCLDVLRERGSMTSSELASAAGLTTGAMAGIVRRLEAAGFLRREPDPDDGRKQNLFPSHARAAEVHAHLGPIRSDMENLLSRFDAAETEAILGFLRGATDISYRHIALLRGSVALPRPGEAR